VRLAPDSTARAATWFLTAVAVLACGGHKSDAPVISPSFYGVWTNVNQNMYNWWEIDPSGAINYGIARYPGKCGGSSATVLAADRLEIPFGDAATVRLSISEDGLLVFDAYRVHALHKRVVPSDICRRSDGSYFEGAPHIAPTP